MDINARQITPYNSYYHYLFYRRSHSLYIIRLSKNNCWFQPVYTKILYHTLFLWRLAGTIIGIYIFKVKDLNYQLAQRVNNLEKFLPICSYCKKIRSVDADPKQQDSWEQIEKYISHKTSTSFSHGVCPDCAKTHYSDYLKKTSNK